MLSDQKFRWWQQLIRFLLKCLCATMSRGKNEKYFLLIEYLIDKASTINSKFILLYCIDYYRRNGFFTEGQKFALLKEFNRA